MSFRIVNFCGMISPHVVFIDTCHSITWWDVTCTLIGSRESVGWRCLPAACLQSALQKGKKKEKNGRLAHLAPMEKCTKPTPRGETCVIKCLMLSVENNCQGPLLFLFNYFNMSPGPAGQWTGREHRATSEPTAAQSLFPEQSVNWVLETFGRLRSPLKPELKFYLGLNLLSSLFTKTRFPEPCSLCDIPPLKP